MAFTGDLENLHIVDIIQLLHTTKKSGTFSVKGSKGESRIIFSNGYIVAANHLNNKVRIGTVLVKSNAITPEDLEEALDEQKKAGKDRKPVIYTLIEMGKIGKEEAFKWLKKLIEITIVELIDWTSGAFTFELDEISVSPDCSYLPGEMEQEMNLDAQMVLMDALRIYDERKRDIGAGKEVSSDEELFGEEVLQAEIVESEKESSGLTADDLGLADVDFLEKKIHKPFAVKELFDPLEMHRQQIREILADFSEKEQEAFVSFLKKETEGVSTAKGTSRQGGPASALVLFSRDRLLEHSFMTLYKNEGILVFTTDREENLYKIVTECLSKDIFPILVYDSPEKSEGGLSEEDIVSLRRKVKDSFPQVPQVQLAFPLYQSFSLQSYNDGIKAVLPKPLKDARKDTFIEDTMQFLGTFNNYIKGFLNEQKDPTTREEPS
jgi:hypothetical protein